MFSFFSPTLLLFQLGMYKNEDIEKLIPLSSLESQQDMPEEVSAIFRDTLCVDPTSRPTALQLMAYSALKDGEPLQLNLNIPLLHNFFGLYAV